MGSILRIRTWTFVFILICSFAKNCDRKFDRYENKIILSESSEENGAVFLKKIVAQSPEWCYTSCCEVNQCTVAVYTSKRGKECYLFNCGDPNICNFTSHAGYTVFMLHQPAQHSARTSELAATTPASSNTNSQPKGTLHGRCGPTIACTDEHTVCDSGLCVCQAGWIEKMHTCVRSVCKKPDLQFQCNDGSACIATYDVCNGIAECRDESDEIGCDEPTSLRKYTSTAAAAATTHKSADNDSHSAAVAAPVSKLEHLSNRYARERLHRQLKQPQEPSQPTDKDAAAAAAVSAARPGDFLYALDVNDLESKLHSLRAAKERHQNSLSSGGGGGGGGRIRNLAARTTTTNAYEDLLPRIRRPQPVAVWQLDDPPPPAPEEPESDVSPSFLMRLMDSSRKEKQHRLEDLLGSEPRLLERQRLPSSLTAGEEAEVEESVVEPPLSPSPSRHRRLLRPALFTTPPTKSRDFRLRPLLERYGRARFYTPSEEEEEEEPASAAEEREAFVQPSTRRRVLPQKQLSTSPRRRTSLPYRERSHRRGHGTAFYEEHDFAPKGRVRESEMAATATVNEDKERAVESKSIADASAASSFTSFSAHNRTQWHIAAILLAIGLGIISCLFGFLVGRCRKDSCFGGGGSRAKAVAASRLRRRIRDSRQAAAAAGVGNDLEKNGLLTGLQL